MKQQKDCQQRGHQAREGADLIAKRTAGSIQHRKLKLAHAPRSVKTITLRFAADCMLGKLARWLRILGHDVLYFRRIEDADLVEIAVRESRILLTRDTRLVQRRAARGSVLIHSHLLDDQLKEIFRWNPEAMLAARRCRRCLECNEPTRPIEKRAIRARVPPYVYRNHARFRECPACGRLYWRATHVRNMMQRLRQSVPVDRKKGQE
ncbi:MAG TPA: Mut7-C RNAse domain-containing protein [Candidatus Polarisedimenticolia bacterium]|nr:Mut7-C RNAse domain-containing protein [Candidatus Polarisedimenticolia bacterium]